MIAALLRAVFSYPVFCQLLMHHSPGMVRAWNSRRFKMAKTIIQIEVEHNESLHLSPSAVAEMVGELIDVGLSDAADTLESGEGDVALVEAITSLRISEPVARVDPRVLIIVSGGVADYIEDGGVSVALFDWDNYKAEDEQERVGVPVEFAYLAKTTGVPVQEE
jgi:hypothetical protein